MSKVLHDAETRYSKLEKLIFALIITVRKLWPYFSAHTILLLTDQPIKVILYRLDISGWIVKWTLELLELDVQYRPRPFMKAQVLVDFIFECTMPDGQSSKSRESSKSEELNMGPNPEELWDLHVNGSSNSVGLSVGLILTDPEGDVVGYVLYFDFSTINNEVEYEALIAGIKVIREVGARHLKDFSDFQLVVGQIKDGYEAREKNMKRYIQKVKDLTSSFLSFDVQQVPKEKNARANALSKLAASLSADLEKETSFEILKTSSLEEPLFVQ
ncbi:uncharacterized protein [Elaeis guineensis]|uniref:uncharacterized protein n=1 Tax=Elaeis guineensis var. tenera TaxID=51953 RepID=UPI003C6D35ED